MCLVKRIFIHGWLLACIVSCNISETYDPSNCSRIAQIVFEWIETDPQPHLDSVRINFLTPDGAIIPAIAERGGMELDLNTIPVDDTWEVVAWEQVGNITVDRNSVSLSLESDGRATEPEEFNGGATFIGVDERNTSPVFAIPLYQQTRPLIVELKFNGPRATQIESVKGVVHGIATSRYMNHAFFSSAENPRYPAHSSGSVNYDFIPDEQGWYTARRTLLGISGEDKQSLWFNIHLNDKSSITFEYDMTDKIENFYVEEIKRPWVISLTFDLEWDRDDITIVDWKAGPESVIIVN